jgi:hypothetical protein
VAFVRDDEIERLDGDGGIVNDFARTTIGSGEFESGDFIDIFIEFLAAEHRVEALDGADRDASDIVELVGSEMLDVVELGELSTRVGSDELVELTFGLATEIRAIYKKENAFGASVLDETINERARGVGLARAGGHLDKRTRTIRGEGFFKVLDRFRLATAHPLLRQRMRKGHCGKSPAESVRLSKPVAERFGAMEREDAAGAGLGVSPVPGEGFNTSGFVGEGKRAFDREEIGKIVAIMAGLLRDSREWSSFFLRFDDTDGIAIDEEEVIGSADFQWDLGQSNSPRDSGVEIFVALNDPAALL